MAHKTDNDLHNQSLQFPFLLSCPHREKSLAFSGLYMKITEIHTRLLLPSAGYELALNEPYLTSEWFNADLKGTTKAHWSWWSWLLLCQNHSQFWPVGNHPQYSRNGKAKVGYGDTSQGVSLVKILQKHHWDGNFPLNQSSFRIQQNWIKEGMGGWLEEATRKKIVMRDNFFYYFHCHEIHWMVCFLWCL